MKFTELLRDAAARELCQNGTTPVFGQGSLSPSIVVIGEQPGDEEERQGLPFVGPAGQLLRHLLREVGINENHVYFTNTVKHFHHVREGKARLHKKPSAQHVAACTPWLKNEMQILEPRVAICLGVTAMQCVLGRTNKLGECRQRIFSTWASLQTVVSWHPAALLRAEPVVSACYRSELLTDLHYAHCLSKQEN